MTGSFAPTIFISDPDRDSVDMFSTFLALNGFRIAENSGEADVVVYGTLRCDTRAPVFLHDGRPIPVVAVTSDARDLAGAAMRQGYTAALLRPVDLDHLVDTVRRVAARGSRPLECC